MHRPRAHAVATGRCCRPPGSSAQPESPPRCCRPRSRSRRRTTPATPSSCCRCAAVSTVVSAVVPYGDPATQHFDRTLKVPRANPLLATDRLLRSAPLVRAAQAVLERRHVRGRSGLRAVGAGPVALRGAGRDGARRARNFRAHRLARPRHRRQRPDGVVLPGRRRSAGRFRPDSLLGPNPELGLRSSRWVPACRAAPLPPTARCGTRLCAACTPARRRALKQPSYTTLDAIETVAGHGRGS